MNAQKPLALGIDLGGTKILSAVVDSDGTMHARDHSVTPAEKGQDAIIQAIVESVHRCLDQIPAGIEDIAAVGVGAPGPSNPETGILFTSPNLPGLTNVPIRDMLQDTFNKETHLINDANAAAVGEYTYGAGKEARHFIYLTVSTGIGGGVIIDGNLLTGCIGTAAELGHMSIDHDGPVCNCGNKGCWETLASGTALARFAKDRIRKGTKTAILNHAAGDVEQVTAETIHAAALDGDTLAKELVERTGYYLGVGFTNLVNIFNPEIIAIGGGVSKMGDMLLTPALRELKSRAFTVSYEAVRIVPAALGRNSGVLGAAAHAFHQTALRGQKDE